MRLWRLMLVAGTGLAAAIAATVLAIAVNAATGSPVPWFPVLSHHPVWWTTGMTSAVTVAGLLAWLTQRWYDQGLQDLVPAVQRPEPWVVDRPTEVSEAIAALCRRKTTGMTTVVEGAGGFGKTTLARIVRADRHVLGQFKSRVYWVILGRDIGTQTLTQLVNGLIAQLAPGQPVTFTDTVQASDYLAAVLTRGPRRLVILDDVWSEEQLAAFPQAGRCSRLVTTRNPALALEIGSKGKGQSRPDVRTAGQGGLVGRATTAATSCSRRVGHRNRTLAVVAAVG
jgi:hypothetical protein